VGEECLAVGLVDGCGLLAERLSALGVIST
jgi:hypothetical protein